MKALDIPAIFKSDADDIIKARQDAVRIHGTDIRSAGNEVEQSVRSYFARILPSRYHVTQGHLVDRAGNASSQLDLIISDNFTLPSLQTTSDGTEYVPIDSVFAIGEIKSTYYKAKEPIQNFSKVIQSIRDNLYHPDLPNTAFNGEVTDKTLLRDTVLESTNRILNRIMCLAIFVDGGDFDFDDIAPFYAKTDLKYLPNLTVIMNKGIVMRASFSDGRLLFNRYPEEVKPEQPEEWMFVPFPPRESGSMDGNHLGFTYYFLLEHLKNSYLEPPPLRDYVAKLMVGRVSLTNRANRR